MSNNVHSKTVVCRVAGSPVVSVGKDITIANTVINFSELVTAFGGLRIVNMTLVSPVHSCVALGSNPFKVDIHNGSQGFNIDFPALNVMIGCSIPLYALLSAGITGVTGNVGGVGESVGAGVDGSYSLFLHLTVETSE